MIIHEPLSSRLAEAVAAERQLASQVLEYALTTPRPMAARQSLTYTDLCRELEHAQDAVDRLVREVAP